MVPYFGIVSILNLYFLVRWMNLEPVIQSEVSQKEKNKYTTLTHMESRKMVSMNLSIGKEWRYRRREQTCGHNRGGRE